MTAATASGFAKLLINKTSLPEEKILQIMRIDDVDTLDTLLLEANNHLNQFNGKIYKVNSEVSNSTIYTLGYHGKYIPVDQKKDATNFFKSLINKLIAKIRTYHEEHANDTENHTNLECNINEHDSMRDFKGTATFAEEFLNRFIEIGYLELKAGYLYLGPTAKFGLTNLLQPYLRSCSNTGERLIYYKYCCAQYYHPFQPCSTCGN